MWFKGWQSIQMSSFIFIKVGRTWELLLIKLNKKIHSSMSSEVTCSVEQVMLLPCQMKIIPNVIYSSGRETICFLCNNISALHKTVCVSCVSSRAGFSPYGPMKCSTVRPPTGWTVVIGWYALIQHLFGLLYTPVACSVHSSGSFHSLHKY